MIRVRVSDEYISLGSLNDHRAARPGDVDLHLLEVLVRIQQQEHFFICGGLFQVFLILLN